MDEQPSGGPARRLQPPIHRLKTAMTDPVIGPFRVDIPEEDLDDLRRRIAATRWPQQETVADQSQGVQRTAR